MSKIRKYFVTLSKITIEFIFRNNVYYRRIPQAEAVALTFDDGPHPVNTYKIIEILRKRQIKATFFIIGNQLKKYPEIVKLLVDAGHEIGNHTYAHEDLKKVNKLKFVEAVIRNEKLLDKFRRTTENRLFRSPYGRFNLKLLWCIYKYNLKIIGWTIDSKDSFIRKDSDLVKYIENVHIRNGDILLFHEDYGHTVEALPKILDNLLSTKMNFETVGEIIRKRHNVGK